MLNHSAEFELVGDRRGLQIGRRFENGEGAHVDVALEDQHLVQLLGQRGSLGRHRRVGAAVFRPDIGAAGVEQRVEAAEAFGRDRRTRHPHRHARQHLLQLVLAPAVVLIVLLEEEDEQGDADADQDDAELRERVAVIFVQLLAVAHVEAHALGDSQVEDQRDDQQSRADQDQAADQQIAVSGKRCEVRIVQERHGHAETGIAPARHNSRASARCISPR